VNPAETPPQAGCAARSDEIAEKTGQHSGTPQRAAQSAYDENSIRILDVAAQRERFGFAAAQALAQDYPSVPAEFIERILTAAQMAGEDRERVIARYLDRDKSVQVSDEFAAIYRELMNDHRRKTGAIR